MKKEILKLTGLTEAEFYKKFPTPDAFASAYPSYKNKLGGTPEAFPQIATADNFFSYGVPVPPTIHAYGGPVYPQIQTEAQFFSPVYSNSNNAYANGGATPTMDKGGPRKKKKQREAEDLAANRVYDKMILGYPTDAYDEFGNIDHTRAKYLAGMYENSGRDDWAKGLGIYDPGAYANWINNQLGRQAIMPLQKPFEGPYNLIGRTPNWQYLPNQINLQDYTTEDANPIIDYRTLTPSSKKDYLSGGPEVMGRGGSYMEVHPEAKKYPEGPVGGSAFYMMQDGGSSMPEPTKDQTFYTQKMNDFFEKLRQASYKNLMNGIMNTEDQSSDGMKQLTMGKYGGLPGFQGSTTTSQTSTPATTTTTQQPNFQMVTGADGQSYLVGPNNQLYSPYRGNQTTTTSNQQQERVNYYPYMNNRGVYVGTGLDNVANWLIPNNPRQRYRNIREQKGLGITDLTEEQIKAIQAGTANIAEITPEFRKTIFPWRADNKLKSLNIKFRTPSPGQAAATTTPGATTTSTASSVATPGTTTANPAATTTTNPATTTTTDPATSTTNQAATSTQSTTSAAPATSAAQSATSTTAVAPAAKSTQDDVNATVAKMQAEARAKGMPNASFEDDYSDEDLMPAEDRMRLSDEQKRIEEERKNYEGYKKYREMMLRQGKDPGEYNFNQNYVYDSKAASSQGTVPYTPPSQNSASSKAQTTTATRQLPSNTNSMDAATAQKKASMRNPNVNQAFIDAMTGQTEIPTGAPYRNPVGPVVEMNEETGATYRLGGPYVLPMYQGATGPSQVDPSQLYGPTTNEFNFDAYGPQDEEFEIGLDFGRTKKAGVNPYLPAGIRGLADLKEGFDDEKIGAGHIAQMSRANQVFGISGQNRGNYRINMGDLRPDELVPVGYTGAGYKEGPAITQYGGPIMFDVADLFFLTPQMLKSTRGRR
jgi:hypothetical protein